MSKFLSYLPDIKLPVDQSSRLPQKRLEPRWRVIAKWHRVSINAAMGQIGSVEQCVGAIWRAEQLIRRAQSDFNNLCLVRHSVS